MGDKGEGEGKRVNKGSRRGGGNDFVLKGHSSRKWSKSVFRPDFKPVKMRKYSFGFSFKLVFMIKKKNLFSLIV